MRLLQFFFEEFASESTKHFKWMENNATRNPQRRSIFCSHVRTLHKFARHNCDPAYIMPPSSTLEVESLYNSHGLKYVILLTSDKMRATVLQALGYAFVASAVGSYLWLTDVHEALRDSQWGVHGAATRKTHRELTMPLAKSIVEVASEFKFFPTFAVFGLLGFFVKRWRNFIFCAWRVEGRLKDMAIMVGSSVADPANPKAVEQLYKVYRYMCACMALQYKAVLDGIGADGNTALDSIARLGLLTEAEVRVLRPCGSRARDTVTTWIGLCAIDGCRDGHLLAPLFPREMFFAELTKMRAQMMFFHGNNVYPISQHWLSLVTVAIDMWSLVLIVGAPFRLFCPPSMRLGLLAALQPWTSVATFFNLLFFWGTLTLCQQLQRPFENDCDTFNIDALIAGTEETIFASLRASFNTGAACGLAIDHATGPKQTHAHVHAHAHAHAHVHVNM